MKERLIKFFCILIIGVGLATVSVVIAQWDSGAAAGAVSTQLYDVVGGHWETAIVGVEYYAPDQHGRIHGPVYRQYFTTSLPSSLTSGSNVTKMVDCAIQFKYTGSDRGVAHGNATAYGSSDNHIYIMLSGASGGGNISLNKTGYSSITGWVDYTK